MRQPTNSPKIKPVKVHEIVSGYFLSNQIPNKAPNNVGTTIVQPTIPIIPRPNQTLFLSLCSAFSLRCAFSPTSLLNSLASFLSEDCILFFLKFLQTIN